MQFRVRSALVALLVGSALQVEAQTVSYAQSTFDPTQWAFSIVSAAGPTTVSQALVATGGNSGDAWEHAWSKPQGNTPSSHRVANINRTFVYDPGVSGALSSLTFQFDVLGVSTVGVRNDGYGFFVPTLRQNGRTFFSGAFSATPTSSWTTFIATITGVDPWLDPNNQSGSLRPDFSANGGTIELGYIFSINTTCPFSLCAASSVVARLDNFAVSATAAPTTVPEPATITLTLAGLAGLAVAARRRRVASSR